MGIEMICNNGVVKCHFRLGEAFLGGDADGHPHPRKQEPLRGAVRVDPRPWSSPEGAFCGDGIWPVAVEGGGKFSRGS